MRILWLGGNHNRHLYVLNHLYKEFNIAGAIIERRENILPTPPEDILSRDIDNFNRHFKNREYAEQNYFRNQVLPDCPILEITNDKLNSSETVEFIKTLKPDAVVIFGSGLVKEPLFSALPRQTINLHLGLSPRYRGAATLFWPFYFMEPNHAGATFHYITSEPDAGEIIHQLVPELEPKDGIHDVACKTVYAAANAALHILSIINNKKTLIVQKQRGSGKNFLNSDFKPEHLRVIYDLFDDAMVNEYLSGKLQTKELKLISQF